MDLLDLLWVYEFQLDNLMLWLLEWEKLAVGIQYQQVRS